jgi:hypothetical protein
LNLTKQTIKEKILIIIHKEDDKMKKILFMVLVALLSFSFLAPTALAGNEDIIIEKLVEKGVLSNSEAEELRKEIGKEEKEVKIPKWVEKVNFKGDLRLRYQGQQRDNADGTTGVSRDRGRFRLRAAFEADVNPQWKAGFGIASGSDDPRSTNQTLDNTFDSPDLRIDLAYAQYQPVDWLTGIGGKFKNPFWQPKDLTWDGDIRPEGLALKFKFDSSDNLEWFFTPTFFIVDELSGSSSDPIIWALQAGVNWKFTDNMYLKFAPAYYSTDNFKGNAFPNRGRVGNNLGNTTDDGTDTGLYVSDYKVLAIDTEIGLGLSGPVPFIAVFGQYIQSDFDDADRPVAFRQGDDLNTGWLVGFKFGHKKVKELWQWQAKYNYRLLEKDAWPDFLPDSDFYGGSTNAKGSEFEFTLGLHKNLTLGVDYYISEIDKTLVGEGNREENLLQVDLVLKW